MTLVGLKNFFFQKTVTPVPSSASFTGPKDWSDPSRKPLLARDDDASSQRSAGSSTIARTDSRGDLESQISSMKSDEKGCSIRRFRVDARVISDATIGLSDGLTVPFALTAGLSALGNTKVVIYGGFAELIAGAISMGLGGYLGAKSEAASYKAQREETEALIESNPQAVSSEIEEVFKPYNLPQNTLNDLTTHLTSSPQLVDFVLQFQHCCEEPASSRALTSALTIALAYFLGGLLPLLPYFFVGRNQVYEGLYISIAVMVVALFVFGYVKTCVVIGWDGGKKARAGCFGGVQMVIVGGAAAAAAMGLVKLSNQDEGGITKAG